MLYNNEDTEFKIFVVMRSLDFHTVLFIKGAGVLVPQLLGHGDTMGSCVITPEFSPCLYLTV